MTTAATWHGTHSGYRSHGCRCEPCTAAHNTRQAYWYRLKGYDTWTPSVDTEPVRQHIAMLREYGIGVLRVGELADVNRSVIQKIVYSHQGRPPQRRVRENIARKILAVQPTFDHLADGAVIPGAGTTRRAQALIRVGWPAADLAQRLQVCRRRVDQLLNAERVTVKSARIIKALYEELWNEDPLDHGVSEDSKARAISRGEANDWPPPAAWDDDEIDDPNAVADPGGIVSFLERAELRREEIEHLAWCGHEPEQIRARLNDEVSISTVRQIVQDWRTGQKRQRKASQDTELAA